MINKMIQAVLLIIGLLCFVGCGLIQQPSLPHKIVGTTFLHNFDFDGKPVQIQVRGVPERAIVARPEILDALLALHAENHICAVYITRDKIEQIPELQKKMPKAVFYTSEMDRETALMMHPDFIAGWLFDFTGKGRSIGSSSFWEERNVNIYMNLMNGAEFKAHHTIEDELQYITDLGKIVGNETKAASLVAGINNKILRCRQQLAAKKRLKVLVVGNFGKIITIYTPRTLAGDILTKLGADVIGKNQEAVGENEYISYEEILISQPDIIFLQCSPENENMLLKSVYNNPALRNVKCIKNRQVYCIPFYTIRSPGVRIDDAVDIFAKGLIKGSE